MTTCTAFTHHRFLASGAPAEVARVVKRTLEADPGATVLTFDDATGRMVEFDLRGSEADVAARFLPTPTATSGPNDDPAAPRAAGRPKLGVVGREVTLLPRHWEWLASQPGGASVTLRKLVDAARIANRGRDAARQAQMAADRFMLTMLGDAPGYEEAARALYAGDGATFAARTEPWPADLRDHARRLAAAALGSVDVEDDAVDTAPAAAIDKSSPST